MKFCWLVTCAGLFAMAGLSGATIQYDLSTVGLTPGGKTIYRYNYVVSGVTLQANQEIDLLFAPGLYTSLFNAQTSSGFDVMLFQPDNPPGTTGDFSALARVNNPLLTPFSVDFTFIGSGIPGSQPFEINQFDQNLKFVSTLQSGVTTPRSAVPEPGTFPMAVVMLFGAGAGLIVRRFVRASGA